MYPAFNVSPGRREDSSTPRHAVGKDSRVDAEDEFAMSGLRPESVIRGLRLICVASRNGIRSEE